MNSIIPNNKSDKKFNLTIDNFFNINKIGYILKQCNFCKEKRISCIKVFKFIFILVFSGKNLFRTLDTENSLEFSKDVVYRFLNSPNLNWRKLLLLLSSSIIKRNLEALTSEDRVNVFVVDDSLYSRNRSKYVELLARVRDNEKNRLCSQNENIDKRTNGSKLRKQAVLKSPAAMLKLLKQAVELGVPASYVLFYSWFTYPKTLLKILELKFLPKATKKNVKINFTLFYI